MKRCRHCREPFRPFNTLQVCCSAACSIAYARKTSPKRLEAHRRKARAAEKREKQEKLRRRRDWVKLAQEAFNAFIRERDKGQPCISCGGMTSAKRNAGHFRSVGAAPQLRFDEQNCWSQCEHCNSFLSGNQLAYRVNLLIRIGRKAVERLEDNDDIHRHTIDELKEIISTYRAKLKAERERWAA